MRDLLPACTVLLLPQHQPQQQEQPLLLLDPTSDEARTGGATLTLGVTAQTNNVSLHLKAGDFRVFYAYYFVRLSLVLCVPLKRFPVKDEQPMVKTRSQSGICRLPSYLF